MKADGKRENECVRGRKRTGAIIPIIKYAFSVMTTVMAACAVSDWRLFAVGILELGLIWALSNALLNVLPAVGHAAHFLLLLAFNAQMLVLRFGNSFVTLLMVTNLVSVQDLSGDFSTYLLLLIPMLVILLLPMPALPMKKHRSWKALGLAGGAWVCALLVLGAGWSPLAGVGRLVKESADYRRMRAGIQDRGGADAALFYRAGVYDGRAKPEALPARPNIVLIFIEGLSQSVVEDERDIMPNIAALERRTLFFDNYYNHTFATYRGLIGQLYSGHQFSDRDSNRLISLHSVLHDLGYRTAFFNTEPNNADFTRYLGEMGFDRFVSESDWVTQAYTTLDYITDRDALDRLFDMIVEQHGAGQPFFTAVYTLGTHVSFDSPDEVFGDGSNPELNKFRNIDVQIGKFMERFAQSELTGDTVVVITTDHATYADAAFTDTFPDYPRRHMEMDRIPLMIYWSGVEPEVVDAQGRNSLDLAPTLLDYLDLSAPNAFLGESLFVPAEGGEEMPFDRYFFDGSAVSKTGLAPDEKVPRAERKAVLNRILQYFTVSMPADQGFRTRDIDIRLSEDGGEMLITSSCELQEDQYLWFRVWGRPHGQNDVRDYRGELDAEGLWQCRVLLDDHGEKGIYYIHAYIGDAQSVREDMRIIMKNYYIN